MEIPPKPSSKETLPIQRAHAIFEKREKAKEALVKRVLNKYVSNKDERESILAYTAESEAAADALLDATGNERFADELSDHVIAKMINTEEFGNLQIAYMLAGTTQKSDDDWLQLMGRGPASALVIHLDYIANIKMTRTFAALTKTLLKQDPYPSAREAILETFAYEFLMRNQKLPSKLSLITTPAVLKEVKQLVAHVKGTPEENEEMLRKSHSFMNDVHEDIRREAEHSGADERFVKRQVEVKVKSLDENIVRTADLIQESNDKVLNTVTTLVKKMNDPRDLATVLLGPPNKMP